MQIARSVSIVSASSARLSVRQRRSAETAPRPPTCAAATSGSPRTPARTPAPAPPAAPARTSRRVCRRIQASSSRISASVSPEYALANGTERVAVPHARTCSPCAATRAARAPPARRSSPRPPERLHLPLPPAALPPPDAVRAIRALQHQPLGAASPAIAACAARASSHARQRTTGDGTKPVARDAARSSARAVARRSRQRRAAQVRPPTSSRSYATAPPARRPGSSRPTSCARCAAAAARTAAARRPSTA